MAINEDVAALLESGSAAIPAAVAQVTLMAKAYTRGRGFDEDGPTDELAAVITTAAARLAANGGQLPSDTAIGPFTTNIRGAFTGWTLAEQSVLHRYRRRAM